MVVRVGDNFPNILLSLRGEDAHLHDRLKEKPVVILGCTGAFAKKSEALLMAHKLLATRLREHSKVSFVGCLAVNDPIVLKAWARKLRISDQIVFISDANGSLTKSLGLQVNEQTQKIYGGHPKRCRDFAVVLTAGGAITHLWVDDYSLAPFNEIRRLFELSLSLEDEQQLRLLVEGAEATKTTSSSSGLIKPLTPAVVAGASSLPFLKADALVVQDLTRPSVRFDYSISDEIKECLLHRWSSDGFCRVFPLPPAADAEPGDGFGSILLESGRETLFDERTGTRLANVETPRNNAEIEYNADFIVIDTKNTLPLNENLTSVGTIAIVHNRGLEFTASGTAAAGSKNRSDEGDPYVIFCIPLLSGGRDNLVAGIHNWLTAHRAELPTGELVCDQNYRITDVLDQYGINLSKYTHSYMKLFRYQAPSLYTKDNRQATWLISQEPCYVDSLHLHSIRSLCGSGCATGSAKTPAPVDYGYLITGE